MLQMTFPLASMTISRVYIMLALTRTRARCPFLRHHYIPAPYAVPIYIHASEEFVVATFESPPSGATLTGGYYWHSVRLKKRNPSPSTQHGHTLTESTGIN